MRNFRLRRPSGAMLVAIVALFASLAGAAYAATTINGKNIKKHTITGNKLKNDTVTGIQVNESTLGVVPQATHAINADNATTATHAATADNATTANTAIQAEALSTLPSTSSESGSFAGVGDGTAGTTAIAAITFPLPLAAPIAPGHALAVVGSGPHCPGVGEADDGYLCLYQGRVGGITSFTSPSFDVNFPSGAGRYGVAVFWNVSGGTASAATGSWTVTAG